MKTHNDTAPNHRRDYSRINILNHVPLSTVMVIY